MEAFWGKGYEATSLDDLCEVTQLSKSSLYATFGNKRSLLLKAVDRYVAVRNPDMAQLLAKHSSAHAGFTALARQYIDQIVSGAGRRGCFLGNCAAELPRTDKAMQVHVRRALEATETTFRAALINAKAKGGLPSTVDIDATARFLTAAFQGLRLVGKVNPNQDVLDDIASSMLRCLKH